MDYKKNTLMDFYRFCHLGKLEKDISFILKQNGIKCSVKLYCIATCPQFFNLIPSTTRILCLIYIYIVDSHQKHTFPLK